MKRLDPDLLHAIAGLVDESLSELSARDGMKQIIPALMDDLHRKDVDVLSSLAVIRATLASRVLSVEDLEARKDEVANAIQAWLDGFAIATRYAAQQAKPEPIKPVTIL